MPILLRADLDATELRFAAPRSKDLALPRCNTEAMSLHLAEIPVTVAPGAHAALLVDQAGLHRSYYLIVPPNIISVPLPPKCTEPSPVKNVWQFMRDN